MTAQNRREEQELTADAQGLVELTAQVVRESRRFADTAAERWPPLAEDSQKIVMAADRLHALVVVTAEATEPFDVRAVRHDLRTPLNHILGYSDLLLEDIPSLSEPEQAEAAALLKRLQSEARVILNTVNGLSPHSFAGQKKEENLKPAATGARILVVDDIDTNRDVLRRRLMRLGHTVQEASDGFAALELLQKEPFDLVLLDIMMPGLDGREALVRIKSDAELRHIPVIVVSALNEMESVVRCIEVGAEDYLQKPIEPTILNARIGACLEKKRLHDQERVYRRQIESYNEELELRVQQQVKQISMAQIATIFALSKLAESRDPETGAHLERMREYSRLLAEQLGRFGAHSVIDQAYIENLYTASALHDIGKVGVPDRILQKPDKLTPEEFAIMKTHSTIGAETLRAVDREHPGNAIITLGIEIAESHHERWDGAGYPRGLAGSEIPLAARIVALADVYDALRSKRTYKPPFDHQTSRRILTDGVGTQFDPDIVYAFLEAEEEFQYVWKHAED